MKSRIITLVICLLSIFSYGHKADAGFQDWLKEAASKLGSEKGLSEDEIVNGLKQALEVGTGDRKSVV